MSRILGTMGIAAAAIALAATPTFAQSKRGTVGPGTGARVEPRGPRMGVRWRKKQQQAHGTRNHSVHDGTRVKPQNANRDQKIPVT